MNPFVIWRYLLRWWQSQQIQHLQSLFTKGNIEGNKQIIIHSNFTKQDSIS